MKNKIVFVSGLAVGYVLGARAGRDSYEKLKAKADELWNNPKVQETVADATEAVKNKAPEVQEQAGDAVKKAQDSVKDAMHRSDGAASGSAGGTGGAGNSGGAGNLGSAGNAGSAGHAGHPGHPGSAAHTGPSGGNPAEVEDTPFQNQSDETRPDIL